MVVGKWLLISVQEKLLTAKFCMRRMPKLLDFQQSVVMNLYVSGRLLRLLENVFLDNFFSFKKLLLAEKHLFECKNRNEESKFFHAAQLKS